MKQITVDPSTCDASGLSTRPWETRGQTIEVADQPMARGGQGEIYPVVRIDGQRAADLLVKIFPQGFPPSLHRIIAAVRDNNTQYGIEQCTALRALQLFLFTGTLQGKSVQGYVMRRVTGKPLSDIYNDVNDHNAYINLPWEDRIELCRQFVEGMHILYSLRIVHADLNGQNLMIDMAQRTLTIIDLDGGAVGGTGLTPVTIGKLEPGWLAPEIMHKLAQTTQRQAIPVGIAVDLWSTACGVHHLLFGLAPFFFMAQQHQIADYLARYAWPHLNGLQGIAVQNQAAFDYYERAYARSPASVRRLLEFAFRQGYLDQAQRPIAYQWLQELAAVIAQTGLMPRPRPIAPSPTKGTMLRDEAIFDLVDVWQKILAVHSPGEAPFIDPSQFQVTPKPLPKELQAIRNAGFIKRAFDQAYNAERRGRRAAHKNAQEEWHRTKDRWISEAGESNFKKQHEKLEERKNEYERHHTEYVREKKKLQLHRFLNQSLVENAPIRGLGPVGKASLASCGIRTAADIDPRDPDKIQKIPGFGLSLTDRLIQWRKGCESDFDTRFDAAQGLDPADVSVLDQKFHRQRLIQIKDELLRGPALLSQERTDALSKRQLLQGEVEAAARALAQAQADMKSVPILF